MKRSRRKERNLYGMVPARAREWVTDEDGRVRVLEPTYGRWRIGRWLAHRIGRPNIEIRLDEIGSEVWKACDGSTPVGRIAEMLETRFGERIAPTGERLSRFFEQLDRNKMILWKPES